MPLEPIVVGERASQTMLKHFSMCPRSAYLYTKYRGAGFQSGPMIRGSAFHEIADRAIALMVEHGEVMIPPEVCKVLVDEVLAEMHVPWDEHDALREMAYRWASETTINPGAVLARETLFQIDIDGFKVRAKIDYAEQVSEGVVRVKDWKTSRAADSYEEVARKRADGGWMPKSMQLILYALALVFGKPVVVVDCWRCQGSGRSQLATHPDWHCDICGGKGFLEYPQDSPVASRAERFELEFVYPGIENRDEKMYRVPLTLTRPELDAYLGSLQGLVTRVRKAERDNEWPAVASHQACGICPAKAECPLPKTMRDHVPIVDMASASAVAEALYVEKPLQRAVQTELRGFAKGQGQGIPFGQDMVWDFETSFDKDGKKRTDFKPRALTATEIEQRSTHVGDDHEAEGSRWGDEPPY